MPLQQQPRAMVQEQRIVPVRQIQQENQYNNSLKNNKFNRIMGEENKIRQIPQRARVGGIGVMDDKVSKIYKNKGLNNSFLPQESLLQNSKLGQGSYIPQEQAKTIMTKSELSRKALIPMPIDNNDVGAPIEKNIKSIGNINGIPEPIKPNYNLLSSNKVIGFDKSENKYSGSGTIITDHSIVNNNFIKNVQNNRDYPGRIEKEFSKPLIDQVSPKVNPNYENKLYVKTSNNNLNLNFTKTDFNNLDRKYDYKKVNSYDNDEESYSFSKSHYKIQDKPMNNLNNSSFNVPKPPNENINRILESRGYDYSNIRSAYR